MSSSPKATPGDEKSSPPDSPESPSTKTFVKSQRAHDPEDCERWEEAETSLTLDAAGQAARTATAVVAFTQNQREELRDLEGVASSLSAEPGTHQDTYIATGVPLAPALTASWANNGGTGGLRREGRGGAGGDGGPGGIDLLCGGFPCQDLSVAGKRRGLAGERSGLFFEFARVAESLRPRWILVENVPGLLSSNGGRDFGVVLGTLAELGYGLAWRIVDSRYFGVPQRRRRVFVVGTLADGDPRAASERAGAVLAVGSRCARHPASGTEERKGPAAAPAGRSHDGRVANPLGSLADGGFRTTDVESATYVPVPSAPVARALEHYHGTRRDGGDNLVASPLEASDGHHGHSSPRGDGADNLVVANTLKSQRGKAGGGIGPEETLLAVPISSDALRGEGEAKSPSADAEGKVRLRDPGLGVGDEGDPAFTVAAASPGAVAAPLSHGSNPNSNAAGRRREDDVNLVAQGGAQQDQFVSPDGVSPTLAHASNTHQGHHQPKVITPGLAAAASVRRLTPRECERLQAMPDDWTLLEGKTPDSRRYAALGDAVTASVSRWIGEAILAAERGR